MYPHFLLPTFPNPPTPSFTQSSSLIVLPLLSIHFFVCFIFFFTFHLWKKTHDTCLSVLGLFHLMMTSCCIYFPGKWCWDNWSSTCRWWLFFLQHMFLAPLLRLRWTYMCRFISESPILFHRSKCGFLCPYCFLLFFSQDHFGCLGSFVPNKFAGCFF